MHGKIGVMNCSGACFPAILARRACNVAAYRSDSLEEVCLVEHTMPLLSGDGEAIGRSKQALESYDHLLAVSGCGSACATRLLEFYGIEPWESHMSEFSQVAGRTPPFETKDVDQLLADHLDDAVELILRIPEEFSGNGAAPGVTLGAKRPVRVGGNEPTRHPLVVFEVFDWLPPLPQAVKHAYKDTLHDPVTWARCCVEEFGAEMICLELLSTNPYTADSSLDDAMRTVARVLEAVDVPVMIGGSGDAGRDAQVLPAAARAAAGQRVLLSSVTPDTYRSILPSAVEHGHAVVASTTMSLEAALAFNRDLLGAGLPADSIVMDLSTCPLGYGYEYSYTLVERAALSAAAGSKLAQVPVLFCPANSWAARESRAKDPELGDAALRGPLWETAAGVGGLVAGADLLLVLDPNAGTNLKNYIEEAW